MLIRRRCPLRQTTYHCHQRRMCRAEFVSPVEYDQLYHRIESLWDLMQQQLATPLATIPREEYEDLKARFELLWNFVQPRGPRQESPGPLPLTLSPSSSNRPTVIQLPGFPTPFNAKPCEKRYPPNAYSSSSIHAYPSLSSAAPAWAGQRHYHTYGDVPRINA